MCTRQHVKKELKRNSKVFRHLLLALFLEQLEDEGEVLLAVAARLRDAVELRRNRAQRNGRANA